MPRPRTRPSIGILERVGASRHFGERRGLRVDLTRLAGRLRRRRPDQTPENPFGRLGAWVEANAATPVRARVRTRLRRGNDRASMISTREAYFAEVGAEIMGARHVRAPRAAAEIRPGAAGVATSRRIHVRCSCSPTAAPGARDGGRHDVPHPRRDASQAPTSRWRPRAARTADRRRPDRGREFLKAGLVDRPRRDRPDPARPRLLAIGTTSAGFRRLQRDVGSRAERDHAPHLHRAETSGHPAQSPTGPWGPGVTQTARSGSTPPRRDRWVSEPLALWLGPAQLLGADRPKVREATASDRIARTPSGHAEPTLGPAKCR